MKCAWRKILTAATALVMVGAMPVGHAALAQAPEANKKAAARAAPPAARAAPPAARAAPRAAPAAPRQVARPPAPRPAARAPARAPATVQRARPQRPAAAQQRAPQPRAAERSRAPARAAQPKVARDRARQQVQERQQQLRARQAAPQPQPSQPKQVERKQVDQGARRPNLAATPRAQPAARVQATDQQRREVRQRLVGNRGAERISRRGLNATLTVGSRIPRRHRLHRFAPALLALVPAYAAYRYLIVDDEICVVDPDTYAIVDVIPSSIEQAVSPPVQRPVLALSADQMRCIYAVTPKDQARVDLRIRLALGAEIPRDVELFAFPEDGLACAPELAGYRYVVVQDDVIVVDPVDYSIAGVISG